MSDGTDGLTFCETERTYLIDPGATCTGITIDNAIPSIEVDNTAGNMGCTG